MHSVLSCFPQKLVCVYHELDLIFLFEGTMSGSVVKGAAGCVPGAQLVYT